jgi:hypothetical protein
MEEYREVGADAEEAGIEHFLRVRADHHVVAVGCRTPEELVTDCAADKEDVHESGLSIAGAVRLVLCYAFQMVGEAVRIARDSYIQRISHTPEFDDLCVRWRTILVPRLSRRLHSPVSHERSAAQRSTVL